MDDTGSGDSHTLRRADGRYGETVLRERRRGDDVVHELIVNGAFAMDSSETSSERELADFAKGGEGGGAVLVGGLGLGYTAAAVLDLEGGRPERVDVVELDPHLVEWARSGVTPVLSRVACDPRTRLHVGDVIATLAGDQPPTGPWRAILLDVDNGPDFLIHATNAGLYAADLLARAHAQLTPGGVLAVWCQGPAPELLGRLKGLDGSAGEHRYAIEREGRRFDYAVRTVHRPTTSPSRTRRAGSGRAGVGRPGRAEPEWPHG